MEDIFQYLDCGMIRLFTGNGVYLWLVFTTERRLPPDTSELQFVGAAISSDRLTQYSGYEELFKPVDLSRSSPGSRNRHIVFRTNLGTDVRLEFLERVVTGSTVGTYPSVKLNGKELGYFVPQSTGKGE